MTVIYADSLLIVNFSMDFLALYITMRLSHTPLRLMRTVAASALGALWALAVALIEVYAVSPLWQILIFIGAMLCAAVMTAIAASERVPRLRLTAIYLAVSAALGGVMTAIYSFVGRAVSASVPVTNQTAADLSPMTFILAAVIAGGVSIVYAKLKERSALKKCVVMSVFAYEKNVSAKLMTDSGNLLKDPISGKPVIIVSANKLREILPVDVTDMLKSSEWIDEIVRAKLCGFRLVPARSVMGQGMLPCFCPDKILLDGRQVDALVGFDSDGGDFGGCDGIVPQILLDI